MSIEAIADASESIIDLFRDEIDVIDNSQIVIASPADVQNLQQQDIRLSLYLYSVVENPELKNGERLQVNHKQLGKAPLSLDLYYMLTAYPSGAQEITEQYLDSHKILSRAMRIFYDIGTLAGGRLRGNLRDLDQQLRVTLNPISMEDLTRIWSVFPDTVYRPSICYLVSPARIESQQMDETQRIVEKQTDARQMVPISEGE
jgi:hypothetical protein